MKTSKTKKNVRQFNKEKSVFAKWIEDTPMTLQQGFEYDLINGRIAKLIKDPADVSTSLSTAGSSSRVTPRL